MGQDAETLAAAFSAAVDGLLAAPIARYQPENLLALLTAVDTQLRRLGDHAASTAQVPARMSAQPSPNSAADDHKTGNELWGCWSLSTVGARTAPQRSCRLPARPGGSPVSLYGLAWVLAQQTGGAVRRERNAAPNRVR
jgi:hypothetical protein